MEVFINVTVIIKTLEQKLSSLKFMYNYFIDFLGKKYIE